jgi:NNP family nitrate/nitrite transporter-like MFS transporter
MTDKMTSPKPFVAALPAVLFVTAVFFCNFLSRVVFAPLMPVIQADLGFTHAGAGHLFLALALGNGTGLLLSGFVSRTMQHRRTVGISSILVGIAAFATPFSSTYPTLMAAMFILGLAVGMYLPSGIATITSLVRKEDWGKTMALHELAPNFAYVLAPLLAEAVLLFFEWKSALYVMGGVQVLLGVWFLKCGRGGDFPGVVPRPAKVMRIVKRPLFWVIVLFMSTGVGTSIGPYSMIPLYLVDDHGFSREHANQLLAVSRVSSCAMPFLAGWITDKWGAKPAIILSLVANVSTLLGLGLATGNALIAMVILQPMFSVLIFVPAFTVLAMAFNPQDRAVAIAIMGPFNATIGIGLFPTFLGHMGDAGLFGTGFLVVGGILLVPLLFLPALPHHSLSD